MQNLEYEELKIQNYFNQKELSLIEIQNVFRFRTRMIRVGDNYRGLGDSLLCPLCEIHPDNQTHLFHCNKLKEKISIDGDPTNLYSSEVSTSIAKLLTRLLKERESQILGRNTTQEPSQKPEGPSAPSVCCLAHNASTADNYCNASCTLKRI